MNQCDIPVRQLTLWDLWQIFRKRLPVILLAAITTAAGCFILNRVTYTPRYQSTATLYILRQDGSTSEDFSLALKVMDDCTYLLKSHSVLDTVIEELALDMSYEALSDGVSTANPENTRILEVTVQADDPMAAKQIVDAICVVGTERIRDAIGFEQVNIYEFGVLDTTPCNQTAFSTYGAVFALTAVLVYGGYLTAFLLEPPKAGAKYLNPQKQKGA